LREPVQLPIGLYDGYYAGTPEGHILETTQHARISREAFKRSSKSLYNHSFQWQDDDVDEDADKNRSKNVVGAVWNEMTGGISGIAGGLQFHSPDILSFGKFWPLYSSSMNAQRSLPQSNDTSFKSFVAL